MGWRRIALEAMVASVIVAVGTTVVFDFVDYSDDGFDVGSMLRSLRQVFKLNTNAGMLRPTAMCTNTTASVASMSVNGTCSFLNGMPGCCTSGLQSADFPAVTSCDNNCTALYYAFYCSATCLAPFADPAARVCRSAVDRVWDACTECGLVSGTNGIEWIANLGLMWNVVDDFNNRRSRACIADPFLGCGCFSEATCNANNPVCQWDATTSRCNVVSGGPTGTTVADCLDFLNNTHESLSAPTFVNLTIDPRTITITDVLAPTNDTRVRIAIFIRSMSFIFNARLIVTAPNNVIVARPCPRFTETALNSGLWVAEVTILPTSLSPNGNWTVTSLVARNENGTLTQTGTLDSIPVITVITATTLGAIMLCDASGGGTTGTTSIVTPPTVRNIGTLTFCVATEATSMSGLAGIVIIIAQLVFNTATGTMRDGIWSIGALSTGTNAGTLTLLNARVAITGTSTITNPMSITTPDQSRFDAFPTSVISVSSLFTVGCTHSLQGRVTVMGGNFTSAGNAVYNGTIVFVTTGEVRMSAANVSCRTGGGIMGPGRVRVTTGLFIATVGCNIGGPGDTLTIFIAPLFVITANKGRQLMQGTSPVFECCGVCAGTGALGGNTVAQNGVLRVRTCNNMDCQDASRGNFCQAATRFVTLFCNATGTTETGSQAHQVAASIGGGLTVNNGGVIEFFDVGSTSNFGVLEVNGTLDLQSGSIIRINFASNLPDVPLNIPIIRYTTSALNAMACDTGGSLQVVNPPTGRQAQLACNDITADCQMQRTGAARFLRLLLPASSATGGPSPSATGITSAQTYSITVDQPCNSFTFQDFENAVVLSFPEAAGRLVQRGLGPCLNRAGAGGALSGLQVTFQCTSGVSQADADRLCQNIVDEAARVGSPLNTRLRVLSTSATEPNDDSSNTALYALFTLLLIPCLCCGLIYCVITNKRRDADNQYMQDTATFSNVASAPEAYPFIGSETIGKAHPTE